MRPSTIPILCCRRRLPRRSSNADAHRDLVRAFYWDRCMRSFWHCWAVFRHSFDASSAQAQRMLRLARAAPAPLAWKRRLRVSALYLRRRAVRAYRQRHLLSARAGRFPTGGSFYSLSGRHATSERATPIPPSALQRYFGADPRAISSIRTLAGGQRPLLGVATTPSCKRRLPVTS